MKASRDLCKDEIKIEQTAKIKKKASPILHFQQQIQEVRKKLHRPNDAETKL